MAERITTMKMRRLKRRTYRLMAQTRPLHWVQGALIGGRFGHDWVVFAHPEPMFCGRLSG